MIDLDIMYSYLIWMDLDAVNCYERVQDTEPGSFARNDLIRWLVVLLLI